MARKRRGNSWYMDISQLVRLIIAIIPITSYFVHAIARITSGKLLGIVVGLISLFLGLGLILWIIDLICILLNRPLIFM